VPAAEAPWRTQFAHGCRPFLGRTAKRAQTLIDEANSLRDKIEPLLQARNIWRISA